ncbi:hypothetical protein [Pedobacter punctiformis]|uniref:Uncharacterized protein n=1 Tax=Pedobacter punctiformis TaxID=3004097 RepID=A0ABT4LDF0_9SPHI|nr:hypothetical protein [Pedobacter sp. HCMS5-2]MCZ4245938.1 hypothetical protein [Pedobacter sp. HCMS5-2]
MKNQFITYFNFLKGINGPSKKLKTGISLVLFLLIANVKPVKAQLFGDFPYNQTFLSTTQPPEVTKPTGAGANAATFTTTGLQLTPAQTSQFGAVFINDKQFNTSVGIKISFEYAIYGGTGADGLLLFLYDASVTPVIGAKGRSMGYAYLRARDIYSSERKDGLSGAYLGIAFDSYGNFKNAPFQGDARLNGISGVTWSNAMSHITLRGAKGKFIDNNGRELGRTGYPVLRTQSTLSPPSATRGGAVLTPAGGYSYLNGIADNFNLRSGAYTTDPTDPNYRKAFIELIPNAAGGFNVTVKIQHQSTVTTVIDNYWYRADANLLYTENANPVTTDYNASDTQGINSVNTLDSRVPASFRMGFAATTGGLTDIHKIWKLNVVLPYAAEAADDNAATCKNAPVIIDPYANDVAYTGPTSGTPTSSSANIDFNAFQFLKADETPETNPFSVTNTQGTFTYDSATGKITFIPKAGFVGTASIAYNIKGKNNGINQPYGDEGFRSGVATVYVSVKKCQVITNPMLPSQSNQN